MAILPIKNELCISEPFTDYVNITVPKDLQESVFQLVRPIIDVLGMSEVAEGLFVLPNKLGTFKMHARGQVVIFGASGGSLDAMRRLNLFNDYLMCFTGFEHRVSMMHATLDFNVTAAKYLDAIYKLSTSGNLHFTRKSVNPLHVSKLYGLNLEGVETGTVYMGNRANSDVWAKAYDKRQERMAKGLTDPGPMLRLEIAVHSDVGATLRDVSNPKELFYHFARELVYPPKGLSGWSPHGEGFTIEKKVNDFTAWQRLWGIVEFSPDIARLLDLASNEFGDDDIETITKLLRKRKTLISNGNIGN